jgi:hypothetical protein
MFNAGRVGSFETSSLCHLESSTKDGLCWAAPFRGVDLRDFVILTMSELGPPQYSMSNPICSTSLVTGCPCQVRHIRDDMALPAGQTASFPQVGRDAAKRRMVVQDDDNCCRSRFICVDSGCRKCRPACQLSCFAYYNGFQVVKGCPLTENQNFCRYYCCFCDGGCTKLEWRIQTLCLRCGC